MEFEDRLTEIYEKNGIDAQMRARINSFLVQVKSARGRISWAASKAGITRQTYWNWRKTIDGFESFMDDYLSEMDAQVGDFVRLAGLKRVVEGDSSMIQFYEKHINGLDKPTKLEHSGSITTNDPAQLAAELSELLKGKINTNTDGKV